MARTRTTSDPALQVVGPDAAVRRALLAAGAKEVEVPGAPSWWLLPGHEQARTWQEALLWAGEVAGSHRRAHLAKPFHKTSEFWLATMSVLGVAGTSLTALAEAGMTGPLAPFLMPVVGVLAVLVPVGYRFARARAKFLAAQEPGHAHQPGGKVEGPPQHGGPP